MTSHARLVNRIPNSLKPLVSPASAKVDRRPRLRLACEMQDSFHSAIHLGNRRSELTERGLRRRANELKMGKLILRHLSPSTA